VSSGPAGVDPADERRHRGVDERWWFDFADPAGRSGGYACLLFRAAEGVAWWWSAFVADGRPLLMFRADDVALPSRGTAVRGRGIWASLICESPLEHWSLGLESFGVELDDPAVALADERGDVVPFGLDLEWEATGAAAPAAGRSGYGQWCDVHGEVLIGEDRVEIACGGHRSHTWGGVAPPAWTMAIPGIGWVDAGCCDVSALATVRDGRDLPVAASWAGPGAAGVPLHVRHVSPMIVPGGSVVHGLCTAAGGAGWVTWAGAG